jgi:hypothetical protein
MCIVEAPGKDTYGDVDVLVYGPLDPSFDPAITHIKTVAENISRSLGATKWISDTPTINFAIPWPQEEDGDNQEKHVQLDIHICHSQKALQWGLFHAAHGDLWNILGSTIRRFGLTVNDQGMFLRILEMELYDRKKSMVFLTDEPGKIIEFLGLKEETWWKPFRERIEMFEYAAGCRMFWVKEATDDEAKVDMVAEVGAFEGQEGGAEGKKNLKHKDRQRMSKRPIFKEWIDEFIPRCREEGKLGNAKITREEIRDDAFEKFGVEEEYKSRRKDWVLIRHRDELWREAIKGGVPEDVEPALRAASIRTLKLVIMEGGEFDGAIPDASRTNDEGFYDIEQVKKFVVENGKRAGEIGWARQQAKALASMKMKAAKKEAAKQEADEKEASIKRRKVESTAV